MNVSPEFDALASAPAFATNMPVILNALAWALVHFVWQGCVLGAAFWLTMIALRRSNASARYLAGCATLTMMALTPIATFTWLVRTGIATTPLDAAASANAIASVTAGDPIDRLNVFIVLIWIIGASICGVWVFGGWLNTRRFQHLPALPIPRELQYRISRLAEDLRVRCVVRVVDHLAVAAPLTLGAIKPVILLPASMLTGLSRTQLQAIIAHEMAHIRRMDFQVNLLQSALEAALFYHPAVWWVSRQVRQEREYCCDDLAAEVCGNAVTYARALAHLESLRSDGPRLGLSSQGGSLMKRIARLLQTDPPRASLRPIAHAGPYGAKWKAGGAGAAFCMLIAASSAVALVKPPAQPLPEPPVQEAQKVEVVEVEGVPLMLDAGIWVMAQDAVEVEGELVEEGDVQSFAWKIADDASAPEGDEAVTVAGQYLRFAVHLDLARASVIDPEHMPSDGLVQAAKLAYPFNLLQLMPWVAPEAHDVLIKSEMATAEQSCLRLAEGRFATAALTLAPDLARVTTISRMRSLAEIRTLDGVAAVETVPCLPVTREQLPLTIEFAPTLLKALQVVEGEGEWVEGVALPSKSAAPEEVTPAQAPKAEPAQPKP